MYTRTIDGVNIHALYFINAVIDMEDDKNIELSRFQIEQGGIVCYSEQEKLDAVESLTSLSIDHTIQLLDRDVSNLEERKKSKIKEFNKLCEHSILAGFTSASTGFRFGFNAYDQMNFTQRVVLLLKDASISTVAWKTEDAGLQFFTREQFIIIVDEAEQHKMNQIGKYWAKKDQILACQSTGDVDAIQWGQ